MTAKAVPSIGGSYGYTGGSLDVYGKNRAPTPIDLVGELLNTVYACTMLNSGLVASTQLRLYVRKTKRKKKSYLIERGDTRPLSRKSIRRLSKLQSVGGQVDSATDVQEVTNHPLLSLLNRPNISDEDEENGVGLSRYTLFEITQMYLETVGRAHWWVPRDKYGRPGAIWVLPAHLVQEIPDFSNKKIIDYYLYMGGIGQSRYETNEIISFRMPSLYTAGYIDGYSPTRAVFEQVRIFRQYAAHTNALLQNSCMPGIVFTPKGSADGESISAPEARRIRAAMSAQFAMPGRGGLMVSEYPGQITTLSYKPGEVMTTDQYKLQKGCIADAFRVPTTKLDRADSTMASAKTGDYAHARDAGIPRLRANEAALNSFLVPMFEPDGGDDPQLFLAYDDPEGLHDESAELERNKAFMDENPLFVNEIRELMGHDPIPGGDVRYVPNNLVGVDASGKVVHEATAQTPPPTPAKPSVKKSRPMPVGSFVDER